MHQPYRLNARGAIEVEWVCNAIDPLPSFRKSRCLDEYYADDSLEVSLTRSGQAHSFKAQIRSEYDTAKVNERVRYLGFRNRAAGAHARFQSHQHRSRVASRQGDPRAFHRRIPTSIQDTSDDADCMMCISDGPAQDFLFVSYGMTGRCSDGGTYACSSQNHRRRKGGCDHTHLLPDDVEGVLGPCCVHTPTRM